MHTQKFQAGFVVTNIYTEYNKRCGRFIDLFRKQLSGFNFDIYCAHLIVQSDEHSKLIKIQ